MLDWKNFLRIFSRQRFLFKFIYSDAYWMVPLQSHIFPVTKFRIIYEHLLRMGAKKENFLSPQPALEEDILLVHSAKYLKKLKTEKLSHAELMALELPFSPEVLDFFKLQVGGTILASEWALKEGIAVHIGGGFHHAFSDHGEGFCVFNDVAIALEKLRKEGKIAKAMVVDLDVHQGNGTAEIFFQKNYAFTFSLHQMDIYPAEKTTSTVDVGLWSGDGDEKYLAVLRSHFPRLYDEFRPDLVFYLAGADPFKRDQLGGLQLTLEGLKERGEIILNGAGKRSLPVVVLLGGGYAVDVEETALVHLNTIQVAQKVQKMYPSGKRSLLLKKASKVPREE